MKIYKSSLIFVFGLLNILFVSAQLVTYPGLPNDHLKSTEYTVNVKIGEDVYQDSYVYEYLVNIGTENDRNIYDPYNISSVNKQNALTDNHWTSVSYNNNGDASGEIRA